MPVQSPVPPISQPPQISLILPAYNERRRILDTLRDATGYFESEGIAYEIIVVADGDDFSREAVTIAYANDPRIQVRGSPDRRGKGRGIREGVLSSRGHWVGFADADGKTPISEFSKFLPFLKSGVSVVIGTRRLKGFESRSQRLWYRSFGSATFNNLIQWFMGLNGIPDTQCGFKFFQREAGLSLFSKQKVDGYMFDVEILILARKMDYPITQVPIEWHDDQDSRFKLIRGILQNTFELLSIRFARGSR